MSSLLTLVQILGTIDQLQLAACSGRSSSPAHTHQLSSQSISPLSAIDGRVVPPSSHKPSSFAYTHPNPAPVITGRREEASNMAGSMSREDSGHGQAGAGSELASKPLLLTSTTTLKTMSDNNQRYDNLFLDDVG